MFSKLLFVLLFAALSFEGHTSDSQPSGPGENLESLSCAPINNPRQRNWADVTAPILSEIYQTERGHPLENGFRTTHGVFPFDQLLSGPANWHELIERCAAGRSGGAERHYFLTDLAFEIAIHFGLLPTDGDDRGNPDIRSRHVAYWMERNNGINLDQAKDLLNRLGYNPLIDISKGKRKINL